MGTDPSEVFRALGTDPSEVFRVWGTDPSSLPNNVFKGFSGSVPTEIKADQSVRHLKSDDFPKSSVCSPPPPDLSGKSPSHVDMQTPIASAMSSRNDTAFLCVSSDTRQRPVKTNVEEPYIHTISQPNQNVKFVYAASSVYPFFLGGRCGHAQYRHAESRNV